MPSGRHGLERETVEASQRGRLQAAVAELTAERGYDNTSVSDIVKRAGTSKRTFYEYFADRQACYLSAYDAFMERMFAAIAESLTPGAGPEQRLIEGFHGALDMFMANPQDTQAFLVEVGAAGPVAFDRRAEWMNRMAQALIATHDETIESHPTFARMSEFEALVVVAAFLEITYMKVRADGPERLKDTFTDFDRFAHWLVRGASRS